MKLGKLEGGEYNRLETIAAAGHCTRLDIDSCACDSGYCGYSMSSVKLRPHLYSFDMNELFICRLRGNEMYNAVLNMWVYLFNVLVKYISLTCVDLCNFNSQYTNSKTK